VVVAVVREINRVPLQAAAAGLSLCHAKEYCGLDESLDVEHGQTVPVITLMVHVSPNRFIQSRNRSWSVI
jgi:hypothetical protein